MNKDIEPLRIDEMGIEVCIMCDCAVGEIDWRENRGINNG